MEQVALRFVSQLLLASDHGIRTLDDMVAQEDGGGGAAEDLTALITSGHIDVLQENYDEANVLMKAASQTEHVATLEAILSGVAKTTVDLADPTGRTALFYAASRSSSDYPDLVLSLVQTLVEHGASTEHRDTEGNTPLMLCRHVEVAEYLLSRGSDINHVNKKGLTVLMNAIKYPRIQLIDFYISRGADINFKSPPSGDTALQLAVNTLLPGYAEECEQIVQSLLLAGADPSNVEIPNAKGTEQTRRGVVIIRRMVEEAKKDPERVYALAKLHHIASIRHNSYGTMAARVPAVNYTTKRPSTTDGDATLPVLQAVCSLSDNTFGVLRDMMTPLWATNASFRM